MTESSMPWDDIKTPKHDYNIRKILNTGFVKANWAKDPRGCFLLILELMGNHTEEFLRHDTMVQGINIDLRSGLTECDQILVLTLERNVDQDLFFSLCKTLLESLKPVTDYNVAVSVAMANIKRWKAFLSGKKRRLLSSEEVRGLFAELHFLVQLYGNLLEKGEAVGSWHGPERAQQDFIFRDTVVEVKSISGRDRNVIRISSEDQLDSLCSRIFLTAFRLVEAPDLPKAMSLNDLVKMVSDSLPSGDILTEFEDKVSAYGYVELRDYDQPKFMVPEQITFFVQGDFPRLIRSQLPDGIRKVSYEIEIEKLTAFKCAEGDIWEA